MIYDVKPDLTYKARLVCNGSRHLIADSQNLKFLQGDIGNAFIQAHTKEKKSPSVDLNLVIEQVKLL